MTDSIKIDASLFEMSSTALSNRLVSHSECQKGAKTNGLGANSMKGEEEEGTLTSGH